MAAAVPDRWIDLEGAANVRDLGGLPLRRGGVTRTGVVVRADNLQGLTAGDVERLVALGVRHVVDLRTTAELELEGPGPLVGDDRVAITHRSLHPETGGHTDIFPTGDRDGYDDEPVMVRAYAGYLADRPDSLAAAISDLAAAEGTTVVHCAAGKDRTGVVCALALEVAGVERDAIVADYVATGERMQAIAARLLASATYAGDLDDIPTDAHLPRAETMRRFLTLVDERHGGAAGWLREAGLSEADLARLGARLTGRAPSRPGP